MYILIFCHSLAVFAGAVLVAKPNDGVGYSHNIHSMICVAFGYPLPQFTWQKGSTTINPQSDPSIYVNTTSVTTSDGTLFAVSILTFCALRMTDAGTYRCNVISNPNDQYSFLNGVQSATFSLTVTIEREYYLRTVKDAHKNI